MLSALITLLKSRFDFPPMLRENEIHTFLVSCDKEDPWPLLKDVLTPQECERTFRFHFEKDRRMHATGRGLLRLLIARYEQVNPEQVHFGVGEHGKPFLSPNPGKLEFNVSHSGHAVLLGFARRYPLGVDVEQFRDSDREEIAQRFFSPREYQKMMGLPKEARRDAFYACWTRKEAFIKACGTGLSYPLSAFEVSLLPDEEPRIVSVKSNPSEADSWSMMEIPALPGFRAACAVRARGLRLISFGPLELGDLVPSAPNS